MVKVSLLFLYSKVKKNRLLLTQKNIFESQNFTVFYIQFYNNWKAKNIFTAILIALLNSGACRKKTLGTLSKKVILQTKLTEKDMEFYFLISFIVIFFLTYKRKLQIKETKKAIQENPCMAKKALADQTWHSFVAIFHIFLYTDLEFVIQ